MTEQDRFFVFFAVWVVYGLATGLFMWKSSPEAKREWFPRLTVLTGLLFVAFSYWVAPDPRILLYVVPAVAFITFINLRATKFCPSCGAYHQSMGPFYRVRFCRKCGAELE
jgi:hypothetical protein